MALLSAFGANDGYTIHNVCRNLSYIMYAEIFRPFETNVHNIFFLLALGRSPTSATL
jgi:hypothetical protein